MSEIDTIRWGDTQSVMIAAAALVVEGPPPVAVSKQMLNCKWERPVVWRLLVSLFAQIGPDDVGNVTFDVQVSVQIGLGGVNQLLPLTLVHFASPYASNIQFFDIPAEAMQIQFAVGNVVGAVLDPLADMVTVTAMAAPHAEPGAIAMMRNHLGAPTHVVSPDSQGLPRWIGTPHPEHEAGMPYGFDDGQLRYRP